MQREDTRRALKYEVLKEVSELKFNDELTQEKIEKIPYNTSESSACDGKNADTSA